MHAFIWALMRVPAPDVPVTADIVDGAAAPVLLGAARDAYMVLVTAAWLASAV